MVRERRRNRLPKSIHIELLKYFCAGTMARSAAELTGVNRNTAILFFHKLREVIFAELAASEPGLMGGEVEADESYFGGRRKGKRAAPMTARRSGRSTSSTTARQAFACKRREGVQP